MSKFSQVKQGDIALIRQTKEGRIQQIGLTVEQSKMLQIFLSYLSSESPLITMPKEYDLVLKIDSINENKEQTFLDKA